jgi:hypothetical protein
MSVHLHTDVESALAAVRESIAEREREVDEARARDAQVQRDAELLLERPDETPPRTGVRRGRDRREYDRDRHRWRQELLHKVDEGDESDSRVHLHRAVDALWTGDREAVVACLEEAIVAKVREVVTERKIEIATELMNRGAEEDEEK